MSELTPIALLQEGNYESKEIVWNLTLPEYAPADRLGVDLRHLGRLARLGGFGTISIQGHAGEITKVEPAVSDIDEKGQATATMRGSVQKALRYKGNFEKFDDIRNEVRTYEYFWPDAVLSLNMSELDDKVADKRGLRNPKAWSKELNSAIGEGVRDLTVRHLITGAPLSAKARLVMYPLIDAGFFYAVWNKATHVAPYSFEDFLLFFGATNGIADSTIFAILDKFRHNLPFREKRKSVFQAVHFDRALAVNGLSRVLPIVKTIKE